MSLSQCEIDDEGNPFYLQVIPVIYDYSY